LHSSPLTFVWRLSGFTPPPANLSHTLYLKK
jgi:hypothetical protein